MSFKTIPVVIVLWLVLLFSGCVTAVDESLPVRNLPQTTSAAAVRLLASPTHPTSYLFNEPVPAGRNISILGKDLNGAWLLVLYNNQIGWFPNVFARSGSATVVPPIEFELLKADCSEFLKATDDLNERLSIGSTSSAIIIGSLYRPQARNNFANAELSLKVDGSGFVIASEYLHTELTTSTGIVLFAYEIGGLSSSSMISFDLNDSSREQISFQAALFSNNCPSELNTLSVGQAKTFGKSTITNVAQTKSILDEAQPTPTAAPTKTVVRVEQGRPETTEKKEYDFSFQRCEGEEKGGCNIYLWDTSRNRAMPLVTEPGWDGGVAWHPSGEQFIFQSNRSETTLSYLYDATKRRVVQQLNTQVNSFLSPTWSPNGSQLLFQGSSEQYSNWNVWILDYPSMQVRPITTGGTNRTPQWSLQGNQITFSGAWVDTNKDGKYNHLDERHIYMSDAAGGNVRQLTRESKFYDWLPYWMPDGQNVVFIRSVLKNRDEDEFELGPGEIYMVNATTQVATAITFTARNEVVAIPSPDGSQFLVEIYDEEDEKSKIYIAEWNGQSLDNFKYITTGFNLDWRPDPQ